MQSRSLMILSRVRLAPAHRAQEMGAHPFFMIQFKEMAPSSLRKTFLSYATGKRLGEDLHLKGQRKKLQLKVV